MCQSNVYKSIKICYNEYGDIMFTSSKIDQETFKYINNKSYKDNNNISIDDLRLIKILYYDFHDNVQEGKLIVNKLIEEDVIDIFKKLYENKYELNSVELVDKYYTGDNLETDGISIKNNNSSCFNYRIIEDKDYLSYHALGLAIDINPYNNPYIINRSGILDYSKLDDKEMYYASNRDKSIPHVITHDDLAYKLFIEHGFIWGGDWDPVNESIDYQHFEKHVLNNKVKL